MFIGIALRLGRVGGSIASWILASGFWADNGQWNDNATWNDGV